MSTNKKGTGDALDDLADLDPETLENVRRVWNQNVPRNGGEDFDTALAFAVRQRELDKRLDEAAERSRKELMKGTGCLNTLLVAAAIVVTWVA
jgi:hypothetical protein